MTPPPSLLAGSPAGGADEDALPLSTTLEAFDGKDVLLRKGAKKKRVLLMLPGLLAHQRGGEVGRLQGLDSGDPELEVTFPNEGRLLLRGHVEHPERPFLHLSFEKRSHALCKDVFESVVVFSSAEWLGSAAENPTDRPLPLPMEFARHPPAEEGKAGAPAEYHFGVSARALGGRSGGKRPREAAPDDDRREGGADSSSEEDEVALVDSVRRRSSGRVKRVDYGAIEGNSEEEEEEEEEEPPSKVKTKPTRAPPRSKATPKRREAAEEEVVVVEDESEEDGRRRPRPKDERQGKRRPTAKATPASKRRKAAAKDESESSEEDHGAVSTPTVARRSTPRRSASKVSYKAESESEEEDAEQEEEEAALEEDEEEEQAPTDESEAEWGGD